MGHLRLRYCVRRTLVLVGDLPYSGTFAQLYGELARLFGDLVPAYTLPATLLMQVDRDLYLDPGNRWQETFGS